VQVYLDSADADHDTNAVVKDLITCFDDRIFPEAAGRYGVARDVDGDGRFTILLSSWLDHLGGGQHSVDGFIRVADLDPNVPQPVGNHCDMMYLNARLSASPYLRSIVAHEYMHAVVSSSKGGRGSTQPRPLLEEEGWLDEAMAHLAEDQHGFTRANIDYRVSAFLSRPERYQLVVDDYYAAELFRSHGNRGSTYLFLKWCAERYGEGLVPALIGSSRKGIDNLETATGASFNELYRRWSVALFLSGWETGDQPLTSGIDRPKGLHLREPWDDWEMAGPRTSRITPGGEPERWMQLGTTSSFALLDASPTGAVEVEVVAPIDAELQVTAIPLGSKLPCVEMSVTPTARINGDLQVVIRVKETRGVPVRLSAISWEMLTPGPNPHVDGFLHGRLDMLGITAAMGTSALAANGELTSRPITLKEIDRWPGAIVVKAIGVDPAGHRVSAWSEFGPTSHSDHSEP
jgi:hypothetical protein